MFEDYIQDAYSFYNSALLATADREAKMYYRASVFCSASSLEAFVNFIGDTFLHSGNLDKLEVAYLNDKTLEVIPASGEIKERIKFNSIDNKLKLIIKKFGVTINVSSSTQWSNFMHFKDLRDSLIHAKDLSDERTAAQYKEAIKKGLNANIDIMNLISKAVFKRPLRTNLLDLKL
ncbi:hypothetical protein [Pedobacter cryoconitis]|uniref:hypothetical protein n=1 Tax=Pedobacter cryoconitis TaxID=188932 RepID=UPI00160FAE87|nr:hypothetical protein [Pedobacter cryoconitis]MBB5643990.1 hypothetical protein [Pedobacter cryoconitis]